MSTAEPTLDRVQRVVNMSLGANLGAGDLAGARRIDDVVPIDSLGLLELVVGLEIEFGTRFDSAAMGRDFFLDLQRLVPYLDSLSPALRP